MRQNADLIKLVFASGPEALNRALVDRITPLHPELPLYVVSEFEPDRGKCREWIPWHVFRSTRENLAGVRAATEGKRIQLAAMVLAPAVPLGKMRFAAWMLAPRDLAVYDEDLRLVKGTGWAAYLMRRLKEKSASPRARLWLNRLANPREAEVPVRAHAGRLYGVTAGVLRGRVREAPQSHGPALAKGLSVVIPSRDGRELLARMLPALLSQVRMGEVIVSDNGSADGSAEWLTQKYPGVRVIRSATPLSFARAVNAGLEASAFSHTLLLNNDMIVEPGFVEALKAPFQQIPDLFCSTAQIFFPPGVRREETGKAVWRREHPLDFPVRCDEPIPGEDLTWVLYGSGGCSLFDTSKLRMLGGVSEIFDPAYVEDLDLGYRAWKRGWPSVFCAGARVEHRHRATTSRFHTSDELDTFVERNYLRFLIHAVGSPALFRRLWIDAIRRLQLKAMEGNHAALETLRSLPRIGPRPALAAGSLTEREILALGAGDIAVFPGRTGGPPSVLVASPYLPFPLSHGGAVRIYNLMKRSAAVRDQVLIAFCDELAEPPRELLDICREVILVRRRGSHYRRDTRRPDMVEEFDSDTFRACLKQTIQRWHPAVVQLEFTHMGQYAGDCAPAKTILVEHDITLDLHQQLVAKSSSTNAARWELEQQLQRWQAFETAAWRNVDCVVTMSAKDEKAVTGAKRTSCIPNGVDTERFRPSTAQPAPRRLLFIGSFAHLPNLLALEYFMRDVWPLLRNDFTLHVIAGVRHEYFLEFYRSRVSVDLDQPGIELEGFVADVRSAYQRAEIVVVPLTASAGTNIKVLEAMAMGRAVVSTPAGINGLDVEAGSEVLVAGTAAGMADMIRQISADKVWRSEIEVAARAAALRYAWSEVAARQDCLYQALTDWVPETSGPKPTFA